MPGKNIIKEYGAEQYYHVYSRGVAKQNIFLDEHDYLFFISLFKRYLSPEPQNSHRHGEYPHYGKRLQLLAFCLMPNHVHLLLYQSDESAMIEFMRAMMTSYAMYFNRRYNRVGPIFQSRYRASRINRDNYLDHISRYIHLNPAKWQSYKYSSLPYYLGAKHSEWISLKPVLTSFKNQGSYYDFLKDYESHKQMLDEVKWELAHS